ncbi:MAG TPA: glycosyltransferase [Alphaproteobacteria bacterium]|nr:glycosyltransferase [Alphaproteobacteria bacterium]
MLILHLLTGPLSPAAEAYAAGVIGALRAEGLDQLAVLPAGSKPGAELARAGVGTVALEGAAGFWRRRRLARLIARRKPDLIQCWSPADSLPRAGVPVIGWDAQRVVARRPRRGGENPLAEAIPFFAAAGVAPPIERRLLATPAAAPAILARGRLYPNRASSLLLDALERLPGVYLWLSGEGAARRILERHVAARGLAERVRFCDPRLDAGGLLRAANVFAVPECGLGARRAIPEAWAAGVPVIAAAGPAASGLIRDGDNGLLVAAGGGAAWAAAIGRLLGDEALRGRLKAEGYAAYVRDHTREAVARRWLDFYRRAAA